MTDPSDEAPTAAEPAAIGAARAEITQDEAGPDDAGPHGSGPHDSGPEDDGLIGLTVPPSLARVWDAVVLRTPLLGVLLVVAPVLKVGWQSVRQPRWPLPFMPDIPQIEMTVLTAARGRLLTGPPSRNGFFHVGPLPYYWLAPFYTLYDQEPASLQLGVAVANAVALALVVVTTFRLLGARGGWVTVAVLLAYLGRFGVSGLASAWNPSLTPMFVTLAIVAGAAAVAGRREMLPVAAFAATWAVHAHLGALPVLGLVALVGAVLAWSRRGGDTAGAWRKPLLVTAAVLCITWAPVVADQVAGEQNLTRIGGFMLLQHDYPTPYTFPVDQHTQTMDLVSATENVAIVAVGTVPDASAWSTYDFIAAGEIEPEGQATLTYLLLVVVVGALSEVLSRRGRAKESALCAFASVAGVATVVAAWQVPGEFFWYYLAYAAGVGLALWLALALGLVALASSMRRADAPTFDLGRVGVAAVLVACMAVIVPNTEELTSARPPWAFFFADEQPARRLAGEVIAALGEPTGPIVIDAQYPLRGGDVMSLGLELLRADVDARIASRWAMYSLPAYTGDEGSVYLYLQSEGLATPPEGQLLLTFRTDPAAMGLDVYRLAAPLPAPAPVPAGALGS